MSHGLKYVTISRMYRSIIISKIPYYYNEQLFHVERALDMRGA